jgi:hypothetical protein
MRVERADFCHIIGRLCEWFWYIARRLDPVPEI